MTEGLTEKKCRDKLIWEYFAGSEKWLGRENLLKRHISMEVLRIFYDLS